MTRKQTRVVKIVAPTPPHPQPIITPSPPFWHSVMTDHNGDFDLGAVLVAVVIVVMCATQAYDVYQFWLSVAAPDGKTFRGSPFNPQQFGLGVGGVLGGFAAYKWGDTRRPPETVTTTSSSNTVT